MMVAKLDSENSMRYTPLDICLAGLMRRYQQRVPDVQRVFDLLLRDQLVPEVAAIENDHIAFRTMGAAHLGIASLEKIFLSLGYQRRDRYEFPAKKLNAYWYAPPDESAPRVFISELRIDQLSHRAQATIHRFTDTVRGDPVDAIDLNDGEAIDRLLHQPLWSTPTYPEYQMLADESEYASWVIYNRYYLNHFTISVHQLPAPYNRLEYFNDYLESNGLTLNDSGGKIKVSADGLLRQSSTVAQMIDAEFPDGRGGTETHLIPGSYVEFAERAVLPPFRHLPRDQIQRRHRRDGFEATNADRIFESTFDSQTQRKRKT